MLELYFSSIFVAIVIHIYMKLTERYKVEHVDGKTPKIRDVGPIPLKPIMCKDCGEIAYYLTTDDGVRFCHACNPKAIKQWHMEHDIYEQ